MSQKQPYSEPQQEIPWEDAVARYLEEHPDYFQRHPELLARITLMHAVGGRAVSLIERQVQVLRDQSRNLQRQLRELLGNARDNDALTDRLHRLALAMVDGRTLDDALDAAGDILRQEFQLDGARLLLRARDGFASSRDEVARDEVMLEELLRKVTAGKPVCGEAPEASVLRPLFGEHTTDIKTWALIPLGGASPFGALCLGSRDPYRFHAGMGTVYLTRLGELLTHGLARHRHG
ncbi:MAG: DUF484 family protein [Gammaproteobacteria bacterium]|nr:DUF484 family protein [Gammaproteobacteria bacterium]